MEQMPREEQNDLILGYKGGFEELERNPDIEDLFQDVCLEYLKTYDKEYFDKHYSGERSESGYLMDKTSKESNSKPSNLFSGGAGMPWVVNETKKRMEQN